MTATPHAVVDMRGVRFSYDGGTTWTLDGVDLLVREGERVALVGSNGSGKSTLSLLAAGLAAPDGGTVELAGVPVFDDAVGARADAYRRARRDIGIVFQNPEDQIVTTVVSEDVAFGPENLSTPREQIGERVHDALATVGMTAFAEANPADLSGGQQQRVAIAGMLAMRSRLLILDEPTAMLDPEARADVLAALDDIQARGTAIIIVTHDAAELAHATRTLRLEHGRLHPADDHSSPACTHPLPVAASQPPLPMAADDVPLPAASALADSLPAAPATPTTPPSASPWDVPPTTRPFLADALPDAPSTHVHDVPPLTMQPVTSAPAVVFDHVTFRYPGCATAVLDDFSLRVASGSTLAVVGRNGSGKTTFAKLLCALLKPDAGSIRVADVELVHANRRERAALRRRLGFIMQHPERQLFASTVAQDVAYGPRNQGLPDEDVRARVDEALRLVGAGHLSDRDPFTLSGGQQRLVAIAGVLACRPKVLVMDEPTASLDDAARVRVRDIIRSMRARGVTIVMITHDLAMAHALADVVVEFPPSDGVGEPCENVTGSTDRCDRPLRDASGGIASARAAGSGDADRDDGPRPCDQSSRPMPSETISMSDADYSWISSLDPRAKMLGILALMFTAFAMSTWPQLAVGFAATAAITLASRVGVRRLLTSVRVFLALFVVTGLLNLAVVRDGTPLLRVGGWAITTGGVHVALLYMLRFAFVIVLGAVVLLTTTPTAMSSAFERMLHPLRRWIHVQEICLVLSLALRFLPTLVREAVSIRDAQAARGGSIESGGMAKRVRAMCAIVIPVFAGAIRHADNLALALDARCYQEGVRRTQWHPLTMHTRDWLFCGGVALTITLVIVAHVFNM
ncbi:Fused ATP binding protein and permease of ABC transporter [Bifidobacterium italicum]|uniref:Fused ATP binding protein and permease of ABC transporter n=1 Tax=Bifidobacterium italicum TaxID=1960968 RepID=A0A2A2EKI9_9BIFI|nr:energy-coupling factor transporter ATPase [Bifidobacterium italicum]PAU69450.1 Fused ATP binding protein and permease of ABC transporter [Bifidobacterium italicum]